MAKVIYKPEPGTPDTHTQFGIEFGPKAIDVDDPAVLAKLRGSPFYEVDGVVYHPPGNGPDAHKAPLAKKP